MSELPETNQCDQDELVARATAGDERALASVFDQHRARLRKMIAIRLDHRLRGRVDASDVLQEAYLDLAQRLPEYSKSSDIPFFIWMRLVTGQRLSLIHRQHLRTEKRNAALEVSLYQGRMPQASSLFLASQLLGRYTSVGENLIRAEMHAKLTEVLNGMDAMDREILALRHYEELSNQEAAMVLGIKPSAASKRYLRALDRMTTIIQQFPDFRMNGLTHDR